MSNERKPLPPELRKALANASPEEVLEVIREIVLEPLTPEREASIERGNKAIRVLVANPPDKP